MPGATLKITNLQEKSNTSPGKSSVSRIILSNCVTNFFENINSPDDFAEQVYKADSLPSLSLVMPSSIDALFARLFSDRE